MSDAFERRELFKRAGAAGLGLAGATIGTSCGPPANQGPPNMPAEDVPLAEKVPTKTLGKTGEEIPILLMGGARAFDTPYDRVLHGALEQGMFYIDTATDYQRSHETLAPFIEQAGRENLWITSKASGRLAPPEHYIKTIQRQLPVLGTDYLEMFFMHDIEDPKNLDPEYIKIGDELRKKGITKYFGFSCHAGTVVELLNKAATIGPGGIDAIMFRYNFDMYGDLELNKAIDACHNAGIGLIAMKTQTSVPEDREEVGRFRSKNFNLHQAKLKAVWADERITAAVSHITNTRILKENTVAARSQTDLSMAEYQDLRRYAVRTAHHRCHGCSVYCESKIDAPLRIADTLRYLMYDECYGESEDARRLFRGLQPEERAFKTADLDAAAAACPQGIDLRRELRRAEDRLA